MGHHWLYNSPMYHFFSQEFYIQREAHNLSHFDSTHCERIFTAEHILTYNVTEPHQCVTKEDTRYSRMRNIKKNNNQEIFIFFSKIFFYKRTYTVGSGDLDNTDTRKIAASGVHISHVIFPVRFPINHCTVFFTRKYNSPFSLRLPATASASAPLPQKRSTRPGPLINPPVS